MTEFLKKPWTRTRGVLAATVCTVALSAAVLFAQRSAPAMPGAGSGNADFLQAADNVLLDMSKLLSLSVVQPLKKSVRSRQEIHDYLIRSMKEDKDQAKRDADVKTLVALGLIPKGYPLEQKIISLLTEQIAGLYDPKGNEFYIADWTDPDEQSVIMAHELTHALQDQHFHIEKWQEAVKSNDDASLAREAVLEGSATLAMVDYLLRDSGKSVRDLNNGFDFATLLGEVDNKSELADVPMVLRDEMLFPYTAGAAFTQRLLKEWNGWSGLHNIFEKPPRSTQQIMHPELYLRGVGPVSVTLPKLNRIVPSGWKQLDENLFGEFGVQEIFKQFLGARRAGELAAPWAGDRYAILEQKQTGRTLLVIRIALRSDADAARYFGGYSEVLELKDKQRENLFRSPNFFSFETPDGGVFLRCYTNQCVSAEGTTRQVFDAITRAIGWPAGPAAPGRDDKGAVLAGARPTYAAPPDGAACRVCALHALLTSH